MINNLKETIDKKYQHVGIKSFVSVNQRPLVLLSLYACNRKNKMLRLFLLECTVSSEGAEALSVIKRDNVIEYSPITYTAVKGFLKNIYVCNFKLSGIIMSLTTFIDIALQKWTLDIV